MKKKFFIFLDIDGTLYDYNEIAAGHNLDGVDTLKQESVDALNHLIGKLEEKYEVKLGIISEMKYYMRPLIALLKQHNLQYNGRIEPVGGSYGLPKSRGHQIYKHLLVWGKESLDNGYFVVIDDQDHDFATFFNKNNIIKTGGMRGGALNMQDVEEFLERFPELINDEEGKKHDE